MIYTFDTYYKESIAHTACVSFEDWTSGCETGTFFYQSSVPSEYKSGEFYKRELPCILGLVAKLPLKENDILVIDGYVTLNNEGKKGLGGYLYESLEGKYPVVGIAKNKFSEPDINRRKVLRGESVKPLYVTSIGVDIDEICSKLESMHGEFRIPTLLKLVDQLSRK